MVTSPLAQTRGSGLSHALEPGAKPRWFPPTWEKGIPVLSHGDCLEPTAGTQRAQQPPRDGTNPGSCQPQHVSAAWAPRSIASRVHFSLKRAVWGHEVCAYLPARAADGITACTATALALHGSPARGGLLLSKDPRLRWQQIAHGSLGKADSSPLEGAADARQSRGFPPTAPPGHRDVPGCKRALPTCSWGDMALGARSASAPMHLPPGGSQREPSAGSPGQARVSRDLTQSISAPLSSTSSGSRAGGDRSFGGTHPPHTHAKLRLSWGQRPQRISEDTDSDSPETFQVLELLSHEK